MKKATPSRSFVSGNPLPENVYRSNKWNEGDKSYRYKYPSGKFKKINSQDEAEIVRIAEEANAALKLVSAELNNNKNEEKRFDDFSLGKWLEEFEADYRKQKTGQVTDVYLDAKLSAMKTHLNPLLHESVRRLSKQRLQSCWREMSYHAQKGLRPTLRRFLQFLLDSDVVPSLDGRNPFWTEAAGGFSYRVAPSEKERGIMTKEMFSAIKEVAAQKGYNFLVDAMDISFLTFLRISDVLALRFDKHVKDDVLTCVISKSEGRKKSKPVIHSYNLKEHTDLKAVISRAKLRSDVAWQCPFVIHHSFARYFPGEKKEHRNQVTRFYVNECMNECMDAIEELKNVPQKNRPSFHEIRALRLAVDKENRQLKDISEDMAHTDTKITTAAYDTHSTHQERVVSYVPKLRLVGG